MKKAGMDINQLQNCYDQLFYYFKVFQSVFPDEWPVPKNFKNVLELEKHAEHVLKERKSQLVIYVLIDGRTGGLNLINLVKKRF